MTLAVTRLGAAIALALAAGPLHAQDADAPPAPEVTAVEGGTPTQLLFVGNSYLYYGDSLHNHVVRMAEAVYPDEEFDYKSATISGAYLDHHDINSHLEPGKLGLDDPFDIVILQGHSASQNNDENRERFRSAVVEMSEAIEATGAQTALYMSPAYTEQHNRYDPQMSMWLDEGYTSVANEVGALVIPVGLAFEEAYSRRPDIVLHKDFDGSHPSLLGTYLAAATTFATLYEEPVVGNPYTYFGEIGEEDAAFLQQVAEDTVAAYQSRPAQ